VTVIFTFYLCWVLLSLGYIDRSLLLYEIFQRVGNIYMTVFTHKWELVFFLFLYYSPLCRHLYDGYVGGQA